MQLRGILDLEPCSTQLPRIHGKWSKRCFVGMDEIYGRLSSYVHIGYIIVSFKCLQVSYSIGYFANDLLLIILYPCIAGVDMIAHHIIIGGFFLLGLIDRLNNWKVLDQS